MQNPEVDFGYFSIYGITARNEEWITQYFLRTLGIKPSVWAYSNNKYLFFYTNFGDLAASEDTILLKAGFIRSCDGEVLNSKELLARQFVNTDNVRADHITGNGLLLALDKLKPKLSAYQTLFAQQQLYYTLWEGGILCSTNMRVMLKTLGKVEVNESAIPLLFLFNCIPGPTTYFRNILRLFPGELFTWSDDKFTVRLIQDMQFEETRRLKYQISPDTIKTYANNLSNIMGSYVNSIKKAGYNLGNLLSGGVDSTTIQALINRNLPAGEKPHSFSYIWEADSSQFETEYARDASNLLKTQQVFYHIPKNEYPDILTKAIETLCMPNLTLVNTAQFALAKYLAANYPSDQYFFNGQCADTLHGCRNLLSFTFRYRNAIQHVPGSYGFMKLALPLMKPSNGKSRIHETMQLLSRKDTYASFFLPRAYLSPSNRFDVDFDLSLHRRLFGDKVLLDSLEYRHNLVNKYYASPLMTETTQNTELMANGYESATANYSMFASQRKDLVQFYLDQDIVRLIKSFAPEIRYQNGSEIKPVLKRVLTHFVPDYVANKTKGASGFDEIFVWMKNGVLKDMACSIDRPGFINQRDFNNLIEQTDPRKGNFLWALFVHGLFQQRVSKQITKSI